MGRRLMIHDRSLIFLVKIFIKLCAFLGGNTPSDWSHNNEGTMAMLLALLLLLFLFMPIITIKYELFSLSRKGL